MDPSCTPGTPESWDRQKQERDFEDQVTQANDQQAARQAKIIENSGLPDPLSKSNSGNVQPGTTSTYRGSRKVFSKTLFITFLLGLYVTFGTQIKGPHGPVPDWIQISAGVAVMGLGSPKARSTMFLALVVIALVVAGMWTL